jgi:hypothetical protein
VRRGSNNKCTQKIATSTKRRQQQKQKKGATTNMKNFQDICPKLVLTPLESKRPREEEQI